VRRASRAIDADIVHVRSYVHARIALVAAWPGMRRWWLLFDVRGFWADERVIADILPPNGLHYRVGKRCERWFFAEADAVVPSPRPRFPQIRRWLGERNVPVVVIPTCAEVDRYAAAEPSHDGPRAIWCGSIGSCYRFDLAVRLRGGTRPPVHRPHRPGRARSRPAWRHGCRRPSGGAPDLAVELRPGDVGICFLASSLANLARAPTRIAEHLAAGMVVALTPGIGDFDAIVDGHDLGVLVDEDSDAALARTAARALALASHPEIQVRARRLIPSMTALGVSRALPRAAARHAAAGIGFEARLRRRPVQLSEKGTEVPSGGSTGVPATLWRISRTRSEVPWSSPGFVDTLI